MSSGFFTLWVKKDDSKPWSPLEVFPFDDANRRHSKRRDAVLEKAKSRQRGWMYNYWQFRDSSFAIEQQADEYSSAVPIQGQRRDKVWTRGTHKPGGLKRKLPPWLKPPPPPGGLKRKLPSKKPVKVIVELRDPPKREVKTKPRTKTQQRKIDVMVRRHVRNQRRNWKMKDNYKP